MGLRPTRARCCALVAFLLQFKNGNLPDEVIEPDSCGADFLIAVEQLKQLMLYADQNRQVENKVPRIASPSARSAPGLMLHA